MTKAIITTVAALAFIFGGATAANGDTVDNPSSVVTLENGSLSGGVL